jgi:hypothetical protein
MTIEKSVYRRLTGRKRGFVGYSQLWLGPGHILLLKSTRFAEEYQRFTLSDIQAIVITGLPVRAFVYAAGAATAGIWAVGMLVATSMFAKIGSGLVGSALLAWAVADIARGPRCRCHLYTAVSRELLAPVSRLRQARAFLAELQPAIDAVQGTLFPEAFGEVQAVERTVLDPPKVPRSVSYLPEVIFALLLVDAVLILIGMRYPRTEISGGLLTTFFAEVVLAIVALVKRDPRRAVYAMVGVTLLGAVWDIVQLAGAFTGWISSIMEVARAGKSEPMQHFSWTRSQSVALFAAGWRFVAGVIGLLAASFGRRAGAPQ